MAATVTTPTAVSGTVSAPTAPASTQNIDTAFVDAVHLVATHITAAGLKHLVVAPPVSRWDGTSWVRTFSPTV